MKLVFAEAETEALVRWLQDQDDLPKVSSEIATIELVRTCRRYDEQALPEARQLLAGMDLIKLTDEVIDRAALISPVELRSLDAVHLASASVLAEAVTDFVVYDRRLAAAAGQLGLPVVTPK